MQSYKLISNTGQTVPDDKIITLEDEIKDLEALSEKLENAMHSHVYCTWQNFTEITAVSTVTLLFVVSTVLRQQTPDENTSHTVFTWMSIITGILTALAAIKKGKDAYDYYQSEESIPYVPMRDLDAGIKDEINRIFPSAALDMEANIDITEFTSVNTLYGMIEAKLQAKKELLQDATPSSRVQDIPNNSFFTNNWINSFANFTMWQKVEMLEDPVELPGGDIPLLEMNGSSTEEKTHKP